MIGSKRKRKASRLGPSELSGLHAEEIAEGRQGEPVGSEDENVKEVTHDHIGTRQGCGRPGPSDERLGILDSPTPPLFQTPHRAGVASGFTSPVRRTRLASCFTTPQKSTRDGGNGMAPGTPFTSFANGLSPIAPRRCSYPHAYQDINATASPIPVPQFVREKDPIISPSAAVKRGPPKDVQQAAAAAPSRVATPPSLAKRALLRQHVKGNPVASSSHQIADAILLPAVSDASLPIDLSDAAAPPEPEPGRGHEHHHESHEAPLPASPARSAKARLDFTGPGRGSPQPAAPRTRNGGRGGGAEADAAGPRTPRMSLRTRAAPASDGTPTPDVPGVGGDDTVPTPGTEAMRGVGPGMMETPAPVKGTRHKDKGGAKAEREGERERDGPEDAADQSSLRIKCNCKKSRCLKLYCDCFAAGVMCGPSCNCCNCLNTADNALLVEQTRKEVKARNPHAFEERFTASGGQEAHRMGCKCKKSRCIKKYCECYAAGVKCSDKCKCVNCLNWPDKDEAPERDGSKAAGIAYQGVDAVPVSMGGAFGGQLCALVGR